MIVAGLRDSLGIDYAEAFRRFAFLSFFAINALAGFAALGLRCSLAVSVAYVVAVAGAQLLLFHYWWFPWTNVECILFFLLVFAHLFLKGARLSVSYAIIFLIWLFHKETAIFVPIWIMARHLASIELAFHGSRGRSLVAFIAMFWRRTALTFGLCVAMIASSIFITHLIRHALFVSQHYGDAPSTILFQYWQIGRNVEFVFQSLYRVLSLDMREWTYGAILFLWINAVVIAIFVTAARADGKKRENLMSISFLAAAYSIVAFAFVNLPEADKFVAYIPMFMFAHLVIVRDDAAELGS